MDGDKQELWYPSTHSLNQWSHDVPWRWDMHREGTRDPQRLAVAALVVCTWSCKHSDTLMNLINNSRILTTSSWQLINHYSVVWSPINYIAHQRNARDCHMCRDRSLLIRWKAANLCLPHIMDRRWDMDREATRWPQRLDLLFWLYVRGHVSTVTH
jgi:hypothetical protein